MPELQWLHLIREAAHDTRRLIALIMHADVADLPVIERVLASFDEPATKVFGFAVLARRDRPNRRAHLKQSAEATSLLETPETRVRILAAIVDLLPLDDQQYFSSLIAADLEAMGDPRVKAHLHRRVLTRKRSAERQPRMQGTLPASRVRLGEISRSLDLQIAANVAPAAIETAIVPTSPPQRTVNTGFADEQGEPTSVIVEPSTLQRYFIEIGDRIEGAQDSSVSLPEDLAEGAVIDVVLFTNGDGIELEGPDRGRFQIQADGRVTVLEAAATVSRHFEHRMFFVFRAPAEPRACSIRCSFYSRGLLIQSRNITIPVGRGEEPAIVPDYILARTLSPRYLAQMEPPTLSLMVNANADGTHAFRFYGGQNGELTNNAFFGEGELKGYIETARRGLRKTSWGTEIEWTPADRYRYGAMKSVPQVLPDLYDLAHRGHVMWDAAITKLAGGPEESDKLREWMKGHGVVQLALKESPAHILPLALFYDYELTRDLPKEKQKICTQFLRSLAADDLADEPCFNGDCPSRELGDTICPSGFWGFRHSIGVPPSLGAQQTSPSEIPPFLTDAEPSFTIGVSTDPTMSSRISHVRRLKDVTGAAQTVHESRDRTLDAMRVDPAPIVYFYCHGGCHQIDGPFIQVGPKDGQSIARTDLRKVRWKAPRPRPIVFINGCHTADVSPEQAWSLIAAFVAESFASGVIGTEVTIFESLATAFAESFFHEFVVHKRTAGEAIRRARLRIFKRTRNPLGLVYIPFMLPGLLLRSEGGA
jgi:hypothetical protein